MGLGSVSQEVWSAGANTVRLRPITVIAVAVPAVVSSPPATLFRLGRGWRRLKNLGAEIIMHFNFGKKLLTGLAVATLLGTAAMAVPAQAATLRMAWA